jgi:hypothetical protein
VKVYFGPVTADDLAQVYVCLKPDVDAINDNLSFEAVVPASEESTQLRRRRNA